MNKSLLTNVVSFMLIIIGSFIPEYGAPIYTMGLFAFSGAITNWLAIYMLFEKIPFLYGSGVIPARFEEFKIGIKTMIMEQFFNDNHIERFFSSASQSIPSIDLKGIIASLDYELLFQKLVQTVQESPLGPMLSMFGGEAALYPMKESFIAKMKDTLKDLSTSPQVLSAINNAVNTKINSQEITVKLEAIIDARLAELTPNLVKEIIQKMIRQHLGWLVVWGGVFGGLIGIGGYFLRLTY